MSIASLFDWIVPSIESRQRDEINHLRFMVDRYEARLDRLMNAFNDQAQELADLKMVHPRDEYRKEFGNVLWYYLDDDGNAIGEPAYYGLPNNPEFHFLNTGKSGFQKIGELK